MQVYTRIYLDNNPNLKRYLKSHSYWYKYLNRNPNSIKSMEEEMKKEYKLTTSDRLEKFSSSIDVVANILKIFKE